MEYGSVHDCRKGQKRAISASKDFGHFQIVVEKISP